MRRIHASTLMMALALAACAPSPKTDVSSTYDPAASTALNIVRMAGLEGLSDQDHQALPGPSGGIGIADVGFAASSAVAPPPGFGGGAGIAMGALSLLTAPPRQIHPAMARHIWAWVPIEIAPTPEAAKAAIDTALRTALRHLVDPEGSLELEERDAVFSPTLAPDSHYPVLVKPGCPPFKDSHHTAFDESCSGSVTAIIAPLERLQVPHPAPPFVAGAAQVRGPVEIAIRPAGIFRSALTGGDASWTALSSALPPWVFIYLPPSRPEGSAPLVLGSGQALPFRRPGS